MATSELSPPGAIMRDVAAAEPFESILSTIRAVLMPLASLRLTVVLFSFAIALTFFGTLAQVDHDVWEVVNDLCFRVWWAHFDWRIFERLAQIFSKQINWGLTGGFYFPGGKLIGSLLFVNLLAAHAVRFKVAASGTRLKVGWAIIALGLLVTWLAINSGMNAGIASELPPSFYRSLWNIMRAALAGAAFSGAYLLFLGFSRNRTVLWYLLLVIDLLLAGVAIWLLWHPEFRLDDAGLRILWQLIKGTAAGIVLLIGCLLVFKKRAGIVLLHGGVGLMMLSELLTGISAQESQMTIPEGGTVHYSQDVRDSELAVIDHSGADTDHVTVVPASLLAANVGRNERIAHDDLPFTLQVHRWLPNSKLRSVVPGESNSATKGAGERHMAEDSPAATGVGKGSDKVNFPSAYVELFDKTNGNSLGTYLLSQWLDNQPVSIDGKTYDLALRFKRVYHPYSVTLKDFRFDRYTGTNTAKNYSSLVELKAPEENVDREVLIWMNNPLRYGGTTFYQSSFDESTERATVLQVVLNPSWMTPYVACMLVATGMLAHFGTMLVRFLQRRSDDARATLRPAHNSAPARLLEQAGNNRWWMLAGKLFPLLVVILFAGYLFGKARMPESKPNEMQIYEFAKLPLAYQGRIKPYDTLARISLQALSGRQELITEEKDGATTKEVRLPAVRWLLDAISSAKDADDHRIFRIESLDVLQALDLEPRPKKLRYSLNEINHKLATSTDTPAGSAQNDDDRPRELDRQIKLASEVKENERSLFQNKILELATKRNMYELLVVSFRSPPLSDQPGQTELSIQRTQQLIAELRKAMTPHAVPPLDASVQWTTLLEAEFQYLIDKATNKPTNPATPSLHNMLASYADGNVAEFNKQLSEYRHALADYERSLVDHEKQLKSAGVANAEILSQPKIDFEVFYNQFSPFYYAAAMYVFAFVLGVLSWVMWTEPLRRASMWLLILTFAVHTFALWARIHISGRPPVTNLYSAAVFIGWAGVLLALVIEYIYRLGLGNIAAAVIGFLTLLVAHFLSFDGDTFIVLQAVLDTQFWLATHVVCVNLGYAATFMTGLWGAGYLLLGHVVPVLTDDDRRQLVRIMYGTLCFAIFFSFVGTVLGGLWADDSWGRFWGWDPKENGALIIVLWNALGLHARWAGLVKGRGLAMLAVGGNIVTAWSYFGVNELGVGLHAYGASESSTAMWLLVFAATQFAIIALGALPQRWFEGIRGAQREAAV